MLRSVVLLCLLLGEVSSAPVSSGGAPWSSSSSSDEDLQVFPAVGGVASAEAPPNVMVKVKNRKTNVTLNFAIYVIPEIEEEQEEQEEQEWSGTDGGRSEDTRGDDISADVISDEKTNDFNNTSSKDDEGSQEGSFTDDFDEFNNSIAGTDVHEMLDVSDECDDFNNSTHSKELAPDELKNTPVPASPLSDDSDEFNNSTMSGAMRYQPLKNIFDFFHRIIRRSEPVSPLSGDFSNSSSVEVTQGISVNTHTSDNQQGAVGVNMVEQVTSSNITIFGSGPEEDSDESDESSDAVNTNPKNQTNSTLKPAGPTVSSTENWTGPGPDRKHGQHTLVKSSKVNNNAGLKLSGASQHVAATVLKVLMDAVSKAMSPGPSSFTGPDVSSSSEEVSSLVLSTRSRVFRSESDESDSFGSGSDSGSDPVLNSGSDPSPDANFNSAPSVNSSQEESEESPSVMAPVDAVDPDASKEANPTVGHSSNIASMATNTESGIDVESAETGSDDVSIEANPTAATVHSTIPPSMDVSIHASTNNDNKLSVEEEDGASTEAPVVSIDPIVTTEFSTNAPHSTASTDASAENEQAGADVKNGPGPNQMASSEENMASIPSPPLPPRRKWTYHSGFLGPISHSYSNQAASHSIGKETLQHDRHKTQQQHRQKQNFYFSQLFDFFNRKQTKVSIAALANLAQSSSEETK